MAALNVALNCREYPFMNNQSKTILIVDSDEDMCWLLKKVLCQGNYKIITSDDWKTTLSLVSQKKPDLVLLDIPLNNISSSRMLKFIREYKPSLPAIVITPDLNENLLERIKALGNCKFIAKPFVIENLVTLVKQTLKLEE